MGSVQEGGARALIGSAIFLHALTFIAGLIAYNGMSGIKTRQSIRVIGGGAAGASTGAILENGAAYSFFSSAFYGGMGLSGYVFIGSFLFLCFVWIYNYIETGEAVL
jgi:hypothetical protein